MQEITVELNNEHSVGLGDNLCLLSALANVPPKVRLLVDNKHNTYERLTSYARMFRIPKSQLEIVNEENQENFNNVGWPVKLFTDYFRPSYVNVKGQTLPLGNYTEKKCIALVTAFDKDPHGNNQWPWCRNRPIEYWARIFMWLKSMNYEVITVDYPFHDLESKVEILAKHCKAMISYEGGMAHLAHMMGLPCFLVNWQLPSSSTELNQFHCEFVHKTNSVYILRDDEELFSWTNDEFNQKVEALAKGKTNNRLVNGDCKLSFTGPGCKGRVEVNNALGAQMLRASPIFGDNRVSELLNEYYFK
jgi:hypothetical protein